MTKNTSRRKLVKEEELSINEIQESRILLPHLHRADRARGESHCCAFSSDQTLVAWSKGNGFVEVVLFDPLHNLPTNDEYTRQSVVEPRSWYRHIDCSKKVLVMEFGPVAHGCNGNDKYVLATGLESGRIKLWNPLTAEMTYNLSDHRMDVAGLSFTCVGEPLLISCSIDKTLKVWDLADDGNRTLTIAEHRWSVLDCACSPADSTLVCSVGRRTMVFVLKLNGKRKYHVLRQLKGHDNDVSSCAWSPDGALIATASHDTKVIVWDPHIGQQIMALGHVNPPPEPIFAGGSNGGWLSCVTFSPDGSRVATLCEDQKLRIWDLWSDLSTRWAVVRQSGTVCRFSPSGTSIAAGKADGSLTIMDIGTSVMPLRHLSRIALRLSIPPAQLDFCKIPPLIERYLHYTSARF